MKILVLLHSSFCCCLLCQLTFLRHCRCSGGACLHPACVQASSGALSGRTLQCVLCASASQNCLPTLIWDSNCTALDTKALKSEKKREICVSCSFIGKGWSVSLEGFQHANQIYTSQEALEAQEVTESCTLCDRGKGRSKRQPFMGWKTQFSFPSLAFCLVLLQLAHKTQRMT